MLSSPRPIFNSSISLLKRPLLSTHLFPRHRLHFSTSIKTMAQEYKLKGITSLDMKNGQKQEAELEGLEGGKVLLAKVQDKVHAMSPNCTHYGAPLSKGVLTGDGRLTCPWHGACFKVSTGDVEDAPALDPLAKFEVIEKNGAVYIKGEDPTIKAGRRSLNIKCKSQGQDRVVVIGGGSGTLGAVEGLRSNGFKGPITLITKEAHPPIDRTKLSKALLTDISKIAWRSEDFYKESDVELAYDEATSVDFNKKTVSTKSGKSHTYSKLILATGGQPRWLPLPGLKGDLQNVFVLRSLQNAQDIVKACGENGKKIVVIGSSFIGMEVGNCLAGMKNDVTVIGMENRPMEAVMGAKLGEVFQGLLEKNGVKFKLGASVDKATPSSSDGSKVGAVHLKDGTALEADIVVEGVGVSPATEFLKTSGVELNKDGSLNTDEAFQLKGQKDVFAIGDIATYPYHGPGGNGSPVRIEHWDVAQNAGRSVASTIISPSSKPKSFIPVFWSALGGQMRYCGNTVGGYDDLVIVGDTSKPSFAAYFTKGDEVVAAASMMMDPYVMQTAELMRRGAMVKKSDLKKGVDPLEISVPAEVKI